ncbi:MAG: DNA mismatch repair endonuclease MutL, partial [Clostridia bacterium]|nr:DNA mismatch repair endonuclease MutL [Clostridia bacterium]
MAKINILPAKVYNRIAAGEVVERPCSVVKELIENSIDAGATEIEIHIEKGGKQLIRVIDNGCGIEREDLHSAFLPHATSKIAQAEDLEKIMTLGFRGEAIASIASVSKMSITSKIKDGKCYRLESNGGELGQIMETAGENGTDVCVEMLFFNAPVRLNFLKTDKGEETEITACISRFILNRSDIAFTYYVDGKKVLQSFSGGDEEALVSVYGAAVLRECIAINAEKHGVKIRGYIGNQNYYKANKTYQCVFLNGRYIVNATISSAISNAYASYLMKRQYPFYVLHIDVPQEIVDVNVHPNKADVRFSDNKIIYGCIYSIVSAVLDGNSKALEYVVQSPVKEEIKEKVFDDVPDKKEEENPQMKLDKEFGGFSTMSYEDAMREMEKCKPNFSVHNPKLEPQYELDLPIKGVTPAAHSGPDYVHERTFQFAPFPSPDRDPKKLHKLFPDLYYQPSKFKLEEAQSIEKINAILGRESERIEGAENESSKENAQPLSLFDAFESNKRLLEEEDKRAQQQKMDISSFSFAGKLFNTYLLYERGDEIYIIDQHAAHERIIFDKLREKMRNRTVVMQP